MQASARYRGTELLTGRVARLSDGDWVGDWRFLDQGRWVSRRQTKGDLNAFMELGAALAAGSLASRYAVISPVDTEARLRITVHGIYDFPRFKAVREALQSLELVQSVLPQTLQGDLVEMRIESDADAAQLARILELDPRFVSTARGAESEGLHYEWID